MVQMCSMSKMILSYGDQTDRVWYMTKTSQDNNIGERIGAVYVKNDIEL